MNANFAQCRLYNDLAWTWPIISPYEDYIDEADEFINAMREHSQIEIKTMLNLGCGGGHNDYHLKNFCSITSVDLSESMLDLARDLNPEVEYLHGDMRSIDLGRQFDSVVIYDAIASMVCKDDLQAAFKTAFRHLKPGGVFITYAEASKDHSWDKRVISSCHEKDGIEITFIENYRVIDPEDTILEGVFIYLIRKNGKLVIETDRHIQGIFELSEWIRLLNKTGFEVIQSIFPDPGLPEGSCPMFICKKPL